MNEFVSIAASDFDELVTCANRARELNLALRRLASTETFTIALDLNHPTKIETQAVVDELQARMRFAAEVVA